jgi:hypothetical protein
MRIIPQSCEYTPIYKISFTSGVRILGGVTPNLYKIRPGDLLHYSFMSIFD